MELINTFLYRITLLIYNILLPVSFLISIPFIIIKKTKSFTLKNIKHRFIFEIPELRNTDRILFHCSSLGELNSLKPLIEKFSENEIIITTFTETALTQAKKYGKAFLIPFDFYFLVLNFFKKIKPKYVFIAETEIWPNFIIVASKFSKLYWINARMSEKSFKYYNFFLIL
jgi:3-deoxy-D-manno-octulosonic-acid transferase